MIGLEYWDRRLHCWGAWLATDGGRLSSTPLARMRALGVRVQSSSDGDLPMVHELERETDEMVKRLPRHAGQLVDAYYRGQVTVAELAVCLGYHPDTIRAGIRKAHKLLQRMLDERRRGRQDRQPKAITIKGHTTKGRPRTIASVVPE
jgi:hypothetical protein